MLIVSKNNGYENEMLAGIGQMLNTNDLFWEFNTIGTVNSYLSNGNDIIKLFNVYYFSGSKIHVIFRSSNNSDAFFAKVINKLYPETFVFDRPIDAYNTKGMPKVNSEIEKHFNHTNRIYWYAGFSKETVLANANKIKFPVVYKPADGNHGRGIQLVNDEQELIAVAETHNFGKEPMFLQEYFKKKFEYRVVTWNKKPVNWARKMNLKNHDFGGRRFEARNLHQDYIDYIQQNARDGLLGIDITRLTDGRIIIIEQNRACECESLDKATGKETMKLVYEAMKNE